MKLVSIVEKLQKRPATPEEAATLNEFQQFFEIDDDDPLMVVLAMMARSQAIVETMPNLLQQKVIETIELHRTVLREQAILVSKELVLTMAQQIGATNATWQARWFRYAACVFVGIITSAIGFWLASHAGH